MMEDEYDIEYPLAMYTCCWCNNRFWAEDIRDDMVGGDLNMPRGCPYCMVEFDIGIDVGDDFDGLD